MSSYARLDPRITLQKLSVLCAVVDAGTVTEAARQLYITQPVVTTHLQSLSERLGVEIFERDGRRLRLTPEGVAVEAWARSTLACGADMLRQIEGHRAGRVGSVRMGASMTVGTYQLADLLFQACEDLPGLDMSVYVSNPEAAIQGIESGSLDCAIVILDEELDPSVFAAEQVSVEEVVIVTAKADLGSVSPPTITDVADLPFVAWPQGSIERALIDKRLASVGGPVFREGIELGHPEAIKRAVLQQRGVAALFRSSVIEELEDGSLREVHVRRPIPPMAVYAVYRLDHALSPIQRGLLDRVAARLAPPSLPFRDEQIHEENVDLKALLDVRINVEKLETLCVVVELGSLSGAAERLHEPVSTVLGRLRQLEALMKVKVFLSLKGRPELSDEGLLVHAWAQEVLVQGRTTLREVSPELTQGRLAARIGAGMSLGSYLLPDVLNRLQSEHPEAHLSLVVGDTTELLRKVRLAEIDLAVCFNYQLPETPVLQADLIGEEEIVLVARAGDREIPPALDLAELAGLHILQPPVDTERRRSLDAMLAQNGVTLPPGRLTVGNSEAAVRLVVEHGGSTLLTRCAAEKDLVRGILREVPFNDTKLFLPVFAVYRNDISLTEFQLDVIERVRERLLVGGESPGYSRGCRPYS